MILVKNWIGNGCWRLPGGGVDQGESFKQAACREVQEELQVKIRPQQLKEIYRHPTSRHHHKIVFVCRLSQRPKIKACSKELVATQWHPLRFNQRLDQLVSRALEVFKSQKFAPKDEKC